MGLTQEEAKLALRVAGRKELKAKEDWEDWFKEFTVSAKASGFWEYVDPDKPKKLKQPLEPKFLEEGSQLSKVSERTRVDHQWEMWLYEKQLESYERKKAKLVSFMNQEKKTLGSKFGDYLVDEERILQDIKKLKSCKGDPKMLNPSN
jgi:hypothetical protein